jgi:hypothetical protein
MDTYTLSRRPLDEGSAHRRDLYIQNTQYSQPTNIHFAGGTRTRNPQPNDHRPMLQTAWPLGSLHVIHTGYKKCVAANFHKFTSKSRKKTSFCLGFLYIGYTIRLKHIVMTGVLLRIFSIFVTDQNNMLPDQTLLIKF